MSDLNCFTCVGRLTADAVQKQVRDRSIVEFTIANNTGFGQYAKVNFFKCISWNKNVSTILPYLKKGKQVGVSGTLENNKWQDQQGVSHDSWTLTIQGNINMMADPKNTTTASDVDDYPDPYGEPTF